MMNEAIPIPVSLLQQIVIYLEQRPYREVAGILQEIVKADLANTAAKQENEKKEEN